MALIAYGSTAAAAFAATRHLPAGSTAAWVERVAEHVPPGSRLLDLGAGTGHWAEAFARDYDVVAVEPSAAMRARSGRRIEAGDAAHIPLPDASVDAIWLSTVIHHIPDLAAAGREARRVLRPGGRVLVRSVFAERTGGVTLFRYFPTAARVVDASYPSAQTVADAYQLRILALEEVPQVSAVSLRDAVAGLRREAHTPLMLITDAEYADGVARMSHAAESVTGPVVDRMDLLVLG